jgi:DNA-binding NarL/FixJ family response regulator
MEDMTLEQAPLRIVLADDHEVVRRGLLLMIDSIDACEVVGEAASGQEALEVCRTARPDLVLMDIDMPGTDGIEATRRLRDEQPTVRVLMFTVHENEETIFDAVRAGASGYLTKSSSLDDLTAALRAIRQGGAYLTPLAARRALTHLSRRSEIAERAAKAADMTTEREREILEMLARGMSARAIAERLGISERTVNTHVGHIYRRLGVRNRVDAVREGMRLGLVQAP